MAELSYSKEQDLKNTKKMREILKGLPFYCTEYIRSIEPHTETRTQLAYVMDLFSFFRFLKKNNPIYEAVDIKEIPAADLGKLTQLDIDEYLEELKLDTSTRPEGNAAVTRARKLSSLRGLFAFLYRNDRIPSNPAAKVLTPKVTEKAIVRLEPDEVAKMLDQVEFGSSITGRAKLFHEKTHVRDLAITTLLLSTGMRVSECVGINLSDVDFNTSGVRIHRKGGREAIVYFNQEAADALADYIEERKHIIPASGHENALFLSLHKKRISVRSVEILVKKYAELVTPLKNITPHKLRSTFATSLYRESGDIYLVSDCLGHRSVETTRKRYAAQSEDRRRAAKDMLELRNN